MCYKGKKTIIVMAKMKKILTGQKVNKNYNCYQTTVIQDN